MIKKTLFIGLFYCFFIGSNSYAMLKNCTEATPTPESPTCFNTTVVEYRCTEEENRKYTQIVLDVANRCIRECFIAYDKYCSTKKGSCSKDGGSCRCECRCSGSDMLKTDNANYCVEDCIREQGFSVSAATGLAASTLIPLFSVAATSLLLPVAENILDAGSDVLSDILTKKSLERARKKCYARYGVK